MNYEGVFVDASGRTLNIRRAAGGSGAYGVRVTLPRALDQALHDHPDYPFEIANVLQGWVVQAAANGERLRVEAGALRINGLGPTLNLAPLDANTLQASVSLGLYDDWDDDLGLPWAFPLSPYRRQAL